MFRGNFLQASKGERCRRQEQLFISYFVAVFLLRGAVCLCVCACLQLCLRLDHKYIWIKIARNVAQSSSLSSFLHFLKQDLTMMPVVMGAAAQKQ